MLHDMEDGFLLVIAPRRGRIVVTFSEREMNGVVVRKTKIPHPHRQHLRHLPIKPRAGKQRAAMKIEENSVHLMHLPISLIHHRAQLPHPINISIGIVVTGTRRKQKNKDSHRKKICDHPFNLRHLRANIIRQPEFPLPEPPEPPQQPEQ